MFSYTGTYQWTVIQKDNSLYLKSKMSAKLASVDIKYSYIFGVTLSGNYIRNGVSISSFNSKYMFSHYSNHLKSIPNSTISNCIKFSYIFRFAVSIVISTTIPEICFLWHMF